MRNTFRLRIKFKDRIGVVHDVSRIMAEASLNIASLEVMPNNMYVELETGKEDFFADIKAELLLIEGIKRVQKIDLMPHEERERRLEAILTSASDGILAIDKNGIITLINKVAEQILGCEASEMLDNPIEKVLAPDVPMLSCLKTGNPYDNFEISIPTPRGRSHYITSGRAVKDDRGRIVGVVAVMKEMTQVRRLLHSVTKPAMITFDEIVGCSTALKETIKMAKRVARGNSTVLLRGESGTGKELFARAIHMESFRRNNSFLPINCAALPDSLLESELFGYTEGSFTGAQKGGKAGLFELAQGGTIFLDEIGEMSPHLQAKLLRILQEGKVRRIGGTEEVGVDVRVIAATKRNLEEMLRSGDFREDLYYRLNVVPIFLPPLRERKEDIVILVEHFLDKLNRKLGKSISGLDHRVMDMLKEQPWPGNIRELENVIERAANLCLGDEIGEEHIALSPTINKERITWQGEPLKQVTEAVEKEVLREALKRYGSARRAAKVLGVSHTTALNKLKRYKIEVE